MTGVLVGRAAALAALQDAVDNAVAGGGVLSVVRGPAGMGKSSLLRTARTAWAEAGVTVLRAAGDEVDRTSAHAVVRQLFTPAVRRLRKAGPLDEPVARIGRIFGIDGPEIPDDSVVVQGLYWLVADLADEGPVHLVVDDAHWADEPSMAALTGLARRADDLGVAVVLAVRPDELGAPASLAAATDLAGARAVVDLEPLGADDVAALISGVLGPPDPAFVDTVLTATGGVPFLVVEAVGEVQRVGGGATAVDVVAVVGRTPARVSMSVERRLAALGPDAEGWARALAVLGGPDDRALLLALAGRTRPGDEPFTAREAAEAEDRLESAGIGLRDPGLRFTHPIVRAAVHDGMPVAQRAELHRYAARLLDDAGRPALVAAAHLLRCAPAGEPWAADLALRAGTAAMAQGAPEQALQLLERARVEPPAVGRRGAVAYELGRVTNGDPGCVAFMQQAVELTTDVLVRDQARRLLLQLLVIHGRDGEAPAVIDAGLADVDEAERTGLLSPDEAARHRLLWTVRAYDLLNPLPAHRARVLDLEARLRSVTGDGAIERSAQLRLARAALRGGTTPLVELHATAVGYLADYGDEALGDEATAAGHALFVLLLGDDPTLAADEAARFSEDARRSGDVWGAHGHGATRALALLRAGQLHAAVAAAEAPATGLTSVYAAMPRAVLVETFAAQGELDRAEALLASFGWASIPDDPGRATDLEARAMLRWAQGRAAEAVADLQAVGRHRDAVGIVNPSWCAWRTRLAEILVGTDRVDEARALAGADLQVATRFGSVRAAAIARRVRGLADGAAGLDDLEASAGALGGLGCHLEHARSLVAWGAALRRSGSRVDARAPLTRALEIADRIGAAPLAALAETELLASGWRQVRRVTHGAGALTPSERRVAELAVEGRSNRQIAQALFVSIKTVETHLRSVYQKLAISGRAELAEALGG